jgi:1,4-dihydroxy-2-naphthoyl-CoA hydrolase
VSIWTSVQTLDELNAASANTMMRHLDIVFEEIGEDFLRATMPVDDRTRQPMGLLHGGASVVLAESIGSVGANLCVDRSKFVCVGQEINANHVRSARSGRVSGTARPAHLGGRTQVWAIEIVDEAKELLCISRLTIAVLRMGTLGR